MFVDSSFHTVDAKNRVFVPKRFQEALSRDEKGNLLCFLTLGLENCLFLFSAEGFEKVRARVDTQPFSGPAARNRQRNFFGRVQKAVLDASGRILLPDKFRAWAGIDKDVAMVGVADRAEIWSRESWERFEAEQLAEFGQLDQVLCGPGGGGGGGD